MTILVTVGADNNTALSCSTCTVSQTAQLNLFPRLGSQLGGTPVLINGLCLEQGSNQSLSIIECTFDGQSVIGSYVDEATALCITPPMSTQGSNVEVQITTLRSSGPVTASTTFTTGITSYNSLFATA